MAHPKGKKAQKIAKARAPWHTSPTETEPAKFPLSRLPVELVHMICTYLTPTQVASIRTVSSTIAAVGLQYLATTVTLTLKEKSFDRLLEISRHPVISKYVYSLHYEHDFLTQFNRAQWEMIIKTPDCIFAQDEFCELRVPSRYASKRVWRAFRRACNAFKACNTYGETRLDQAFMAYQSHCAEQDHAWQSDFFIHKLTDALQHLPNLRAIYMPKHGSYSRYQMETGQILDGAFYDQRTIESNSVDVTRSILLAVDQAIRFGQNGNTRAAVVGEGATSRASSSYTSDAIDDDPAGSNQVSAGLGGRAPESDCLRGNGLGGSHERVLRIKDFTSESLNWRLLLEDHEVFTAMKRSISNLTKLGIHLLDGCCIKDDTACIRLPDDLEAPRKCLRRGLLHDFVKSAPGLEELDVSFTFNFHNLSLHLTDIVGSFRWASLSTVHFKRITVDLGSLEEFCSRHSSTLSNLSLGVLRMSNHTPLPGRDPWYSMFDKIREATTLKKASVYGNLYHIANTWPMDDRQDPRLASGTLIGRYLVDEGGNSNLKTFLEEERSRIYEQDEAPSISDNTPTSKSEDSSSGSAA